MHKIHEIPEIKKMNLSYRCRGCKNLVRGEAITELHYKISEFHDDPYLLCRCPDGRCEEISLIIYDRLNERVFAAYPHSSVNADNYHSAIPKQVREDIAEADRCINANAYKGSVVMNRRAVQNIVLDKINTPGIEKKKLWEQIDALFDAGFITKNLKETAHEIRHFGNFGAHPSDDALENTNREDAQEVDGLTWELVKAVYITPYNTRKLKEKRGKKTVKTRAK